MGTMKEENEEAWKWLTGVPFHHWTRSHFMNDSKCDLLLNNMCESFNRCILRAREEGVLVMLEMIRVYLMRRLQNKREEMESWGDRKLTPKINSLVEKYKKWCGGCYSTYAGYDHFEVTTVNGSKYTVNIGHRSCGCKKWDLSGIPCHHGIDCLNRLGANVDEYVDPIYYEENYRKAYSGIIYPMNGHTEWERCNMVMKPPMVEKQPGRPKKRRRPEMTDVIEKEEHGKRMMYRSTQLIARCGQCHLTGHNRRTCPSLKEKNEATINEGSDEPEIEETYNEATINEGANLVKDMFTLRYGPRCRFTADTG
ncbi:uncharacterized protein LOC141696324 [Apium graveolens]|uniref:uncharacterized protein LOC141696324 n=1 Tax=Apium graveolens TaxID=4045 RepID=UPI003D79B929